MPRWRVAEVVTVAGGAGERSTKAALCALATAAMGATSAPGAHTTTMSAAGAASAVCAAATTMTTSARPSQTCNSGSFDPFEAPVNQRYTGDMARALGRYELLRPLARGGMAEVFLARRRAAGVEKWLVVKRIRPERAGDARFLDLFVREARLSMSLAHQNIVPVFDFGRIDEQVFLAMERVEGRDLGSSLARAGERPAAPRISALVAAFIAEQCLHALDYAHKRRGDNGALLGIVHRDVTPRNVLLSWSGEVKLTDFGIAALAGEHESRMIGTPAYMAPEQARGEPVDIRADLYAVGLILREMLSGTRARPGDDREAVLAMARKGELVRVVRRGAASVARYRRTRVRDGAVGAVRERERNARRRGCVYRRRARREARRCASAPAHPLARRHLGARRRFERGRAAERKRD